MDRKYAQIHYNIICLIYVWVVVFSNGIAKLLETNKLGHIDQ